LATCTYCGKPAGLGSNFHVNCKHPELGGVPVIAPPLTQQQIEIESLITQVEPRIQRAVFRANMASGFTFLAIGVVLAVLYASMK
jgi:hypothetical protein